MCTLYVRNVWIWTKIECLELHIFSVKFGTLYMYGMSGFAENLNIQNCENSTGNCVHYMYGMSGFAKKIEYPELRKFNSIFST